MLEACTHKTVVIKETPSTKLLNIPGQLSHSLWRPLHLSRNIGIFFLSHEIIVLDLFPQGLGVPWMQEWRLILSDLMSYTQNKQYIKGSIYICGTSEWALNVTQPWRWDWDSRKVKSFSTTEFCLIKERTTWKSGEENYWRLLGCKHISISYIIQIHPLNFKEPLTV
jgi:hypothetical protein